MTFEERVKAFLEELTVLCRKYDLDLYGHDGMGSTYTAVAEGCHNFDPENIDVVKPEPKQLKKGRRVRA